MHKVQMLFSLRFVNILTTMLTWAIITKTGTNTNNFLTITVCRPHHNTKHKCEHNIYRGLSLF